MSSMAHMSSCLLPKRVVLFIHQDASLVHETRLLCIVASGKVNGFEDRTGGFDGARGHCGV